MKTAAGRLDIRHDDFVLHFVPHFIDPLILGGKKSSEAETRLLSQILDFSIENIARARTSHQRSVSVWDEVEPVRCPNSRTVVEIAETV